MREKLAMVRLEASTVLDLGCGEGDELSHLKQRFPEATIFGVDGAEMMLKEGKKTELAAHSGMERLLKHVLPSSWKASSKHHLFCANFAQIPLASDSADVIWSNLALHWHPQPDLALKEWRRVLRVGGLCMFSCFGPDSMRELREAFAAIDRAPHMLDFVDMHDFGDMTVHAGLATPVMDMEKITLRYERVERLLQDVRALGGSPLPQQHELRVSKSAYRKLISLLEATRGADGRIPLTFELVYGHAFKPPATKRENGESIVQFVPRK
ncbi:methyltransferase domain-containing protein [Undibacterium cyanobacteriorum]